MVDYAKLEELNKKTEEELNKYLKELKEEEKKLSELNLREDEILDKLERIDIAMAYQIATGPDSQGTTEMVINRQRDSRRRRLAEKLNKKGTEQFKIIEAEREACKKRFEHVQKKIRKLTKKFEKQKEELGVE